MGYYKYSPYMSLFVYFIAIYSYCDRVSVGYLYYYTLVLIRPTFLQMDILISVLFLP